MHSQMAKLNVNVLEQFMKIVERQYKFRDSLSSQQIDRMKKLLKSKIKNPQNYQKMILDRFFQRSLGFARQPSEQTQTKNLKEERKLQSHEPCQSANNRIKSLDEEQQDDLNQFKKNDAPLFNQRNDFDTKKDATVKSGDEFYEFSDDDEDEKLSKKQLQSIKQNTGLHILGYYNARDKKFIPKRQETRIVIYNALLKIQGHDQQVLFPTLELVFRRISKPGLNI